MRIYFLSLSLAVGACTKTKSEHHESKKDSPKTSALFVNAEKIDDFIDYTVECDLQVGLFYYKGIGCKTSCKYDLEKMQLSYCLEYSEVPSQIDPEKKLQHCPANTVMIDDICQNPVFNYQVDMKADKSYEIIFTFHGDVSGPETFIYRSRTKMSSQGKVEKFLGYEIGKYWQVDKVPFSTSPVLMKIKDKFYVDYMTFESVHYSTAWRYYTSHGVDKSVVMKLDWIAPKETPNYGYSPTKILWFDETKPTKLKIIFGDLEMEPYGDYSEYLKRCHRISDALFPYRNLDFSTAFFSLEYTDYFYCHIYSNENRWLANGFEKFPLEELIPKNINQTEFENIYKKKDMLDLRTDLDYTTESMRIV